MTTKEDFTPQEWQSILTAPTTAAIVIMLVSPSGPMGMVKEMTAVSKLIGEAIQTPSGNALIDAVAADLKAMMDKKEKLEAPAVSQDPHEMIRKSLEALSELAKLVDEKANMEGVGFKKWVYRAAQLSSEASKEGGFMGIGGEVVSDQERKALADIAGRLGISA